MKKTPKKKFFSKIKAKIIFLGNSGLILLELEKLLLLEDLQKINLINNLR